MSAVLASTCCCEGLRTDLRQCPEHFKIWNGSRRLMSVGRIIGATFPLDPSIPADVLDNARLRGSEVDGLFCAWLVGKLERIPLGTREDAKALFLKLMDWWNGQSFKSVEVQVLLGCEDHGGVLDLRLDGMAVDLKATYNIEHTARLQVAGYAVLNRSVGAILHVTERFKTPRLVPLEKHDYDDWGTLLSAWRMAARRGRKEIRGDEPR